MIRHLSLQFPGNDVAVRAASPDYHRDEMYERNSWSAFIHQSKFTHIPTDICFTALSSLQLDFSRWHLNRPHYPPKISVSSHIAFGHFAG